MKVLLTSKTVGTGSSQMQVMVVYPKELTIKTSFEDATSDATNYTSISKEISQNCTLVVCIAGS